MAEKKVQVFISHISEEQVEASRAKEYLELAFKDHVEVFLASSWTSIPPGDDWFSSILKAIAEQFRKLSAAIRQVTDLPESPAISVEELALGRGRKETPSLKGWVLRPGSHLGEEISGVFKVGTVGAPDVSRATRAGLDPNDSLYVRLFVEPPNGQFVNAMATGVVASLLEREDITGSVLVAKLKLQAVSQTDEPGDRPSPIIVVEEAQVRRE